MWRERLRAVGGVRLATFALGFIVLYQLLSVEHHGPPVDINGPAGLDAGTIVGAPLVPSGEGDTPADAGSGSGIGSTLPPARPAVKTSSVVYICA